MVTIKIFSASYGDCFLISIKTTEKNINILVDGGLADVYKVSLKSELKKLVVNGEKLDFVINTHIDSDHIRGIIALLEENNRKKYIDIGDIWYNGLEQIATKYPAAESMSVDIADNEIIEDILKKGYEDEFKEIENISAVEGISLASLIEQGNFNHNIVCIPAHPDGYSGSIRTAFR